MYVLGINELYHDCSAALVEDGRLVAVVEEERLNRVKHTPGFCWGGDAPRRSVAWCLEEFGVRDNQVAAVALSFDMSGYLALKTIADGVLASIRRMRVLDIVNQRIRGGDYAVHAVYGNIGGYFIKRKAYIRELRKRFGKVFEIPHHRCHAASAFRMSGFDRANILVVDGLGEKDSTSLYAGEGNTIRGPFETWNQYQSLGVLYKTVTFLLGFGYFGDGKTMGLSAYGRFRDEFADLIEPAQDGYHIRLERLRKLSPHARFGNEAPLTQDHKDIAFTVQALLERTAVSLANRLHLETGYRKLCVAGGVGLNCNMNAALRSLPVVDDLFVQPGAMDMGTAIGAALEASAMMGIETKGRLEHIYYGPCFDDTEVRAAILGAGLTPNPLAEPDLVRTAARLIHTGKILGWFQGRLEFGPRALGNRTIVAAPTSAVIRDRVNHIKQRELWRPLAPAVLAEAAADWFENAKPSPFMTLNFRFRPEKAHQVPGVVHVDGTARVQTVQSDTNPRFHALIREYKALSGLPIVINTSFNRGVEPIVCTPAEAIATFLATDMDALVLGDHLLEKILCASSPAIARASTPCSRQV
jgi:carbamoyltransferase